MHTPSSHGATVNHGGQTISTASTAFHVYSLEWTAEKMVFKVDGIEHYTYNPAIKDANTWPFDAEFYILLNTAIQPIIASGFTESAMEIDYVRVYQQSAATNKNISQERVVVYPNPVNDALYIKIPYATPTELPVKVTDLIGNTVLNQSIPVANSVAVIESFKTLQAGIYAISYQIDGQWYNTKLIKR
jgi:hypothetical protein